jgi:transcriptional regulator with XRE-family HTH domain
MNTILEGVTELASVIRARRLSLGISQEALSLNLGIPLADLRAIEAGETELNLGFFAVTAEQLGSSTCLLMKAAERLQSEPSRKKAGILRSVSTQRQLNRLERQHDLFANQLKNIARQIAVLRECRQLYSADTGQDDIDRLDRLEQGLSRRLEALEVRRLTLQRARKACDENERFLLRTRAGRHAAVI